MYNSIIGIIYSPGKCVCRKITETSDINSERRNIFLYVFSLIQISGTANQMLFKLREKIITVSMQVEIAEYVQCDKFIPLLYQRIQFYRQPS